MNNNNHCVTVIANREYLSFFPSFYDQLRNIGQYKGDINLITDNSIYLSSFNKKNYKNVNIFKFKKIKFSKKTSKNLNSIENGRNLTKPFQWYKFYLFDEQFKNWDFNLYMDINMKINGNVADVLNLKQEKKLIAPYDAYPDLDWALDSQFNGEEEILNKLKKKYDLSLKKYFQTGILYYDTSIIESDNIQNLINIVEEYPVSKNNEQGIMNLYFIFEKDLFFPLSKEVYSYWSEKNKKAIITKK